MLYLDFEAQGRGSTFTLCHGHLKKAILLHKMARVRFDLNTAVHNYFDKHVCLSVRSSGFRLSQTVESKSVTK